jgi:hypothetical protein
MGSPTSDMVNQGAGVRVSPKDDGRNSAFLDDGLLY